MAVPSVGVLAYVAGQTLRVSVPTLIEVSFGRKDLEVHNERLRSWGENIVRHARMDVDVLGKEHIASGEAYVVMSNHQSHFDIPVLFSTLGIPMRMVAKKELFRIPIFAHAMRVAGFVEVDRENRERAIESLKAAREGVHESVSIWIAPEGTRSDTGRVAAFKKGGFHMALHAGLRILPVTIEGTRKALPARELVVTKGQSVRVVVSPPIDPAAYGVTRLADLMRDVRSAIAEPLPEELQGEPT